MNRLKTQFFRGFNISGVTVDEDGFVRFDFVVDEKW
jgi:hypothetical protein